MPKKRPEEKFGTHRCRYFSNKFGTHRCRFLRVAQKFGTHRCRIFHAPDLETNIHHMGRHIGQQLNPPEKIGTNPVPNFCCPGGCVGCPKWHAEFLAEFSFMPFPRLLWLKKIRQEIRKEIRHPKTRPQTIKSAPPKFGTPKNSAPPENPPPNKSASQKIDTPGGGRG